MCLSYGLTTVFMLVVFTFHCISFHLCLVTSFFQSHNLFFPTSSSVMSLLSPPHFPLPSLHLYSFPFISILPSSPSISLPKSLPPILFSITPTDPSVLLWVQACISISQCYLHVNSSSQIFTIVPDGETSSQGWDDSPFVNTITPQ